MLSAQGLSVYLRLQQILLASEDSKEVFSFLLPQILLQFMAIKLDYNFVDVVFVNDQKQITQSYFTENGLLKTKVDLPPTILNLEVLLDDKKDYEKELLWGRIFITSDMSLLTKNLPGIQTLILSPVMRSDKLLGVLTLGTKRPINMLNNEETDLIVLITNLINFAFKIQDVEKTLSDVTQEVYKMNSKLHDLDKLKDDFVSIASHELRTPMTAIRSYAWMALNRSDTQLTDKMRKYLQRTLVSTERLINLVNDMLNVSRIESGRLEIEPQEMDLENLVGEVLVEIDAKAKEKNLHIINEAKELPKIFADPNKVHQILLNLLGNSLKFTKENGNIKISYFNDGKMMHISISDDGVGIAPDDVQRLFKKFSRLDNSYIAASSTGGTGLGLFICKSLVELMKGQISVKSAGVGKGTTFTFSLPVATTDLLQEAEKYHYRPEGEARLLEPVAIQAYPNEPMDVVLK